MNSHPKTKALLLACIIIVGTLSFIQYYLVLNTYQLTKDNYYAEVKKETSKIVNQPEMVYLQEQLFENLKRKIISYSSHHLTKQAFFEELKTDNDSIREKLNQYLLLELQKKSILSGVRYKFQYDEIIIESKGKRDVIMSLKQAPLILIGNDFKTPNTILLYQGNTVSLVNTQIQKDRYDRYNFNDKVRLSVSQSQYIEVSDWRNVVFRRMATIFFLAIGLIIAVIILFYQVFNTLIKQKKIAQIKTDFANNITHELKTPLSSINVILKSLEKKEVRSDESIFNELLEILNRQHFRINQIVDSVLESALSSELKIEKENLDIGNYLRRYAADLKLADHTLIVDIAPCSSHVFTNTNLLEKTLNNLVENSIKYSNKGTNIYIKSFITPDNYIIEIIDQGPGIAQEYQRYIFDKFYRIINSNKQTANGLGLGLFISKQAISQLGGTINVNSKTGHGSIFSIKLPL